jgi:hypothetical protein
VILNESQWWRKAAGGAGERMRRTRIIVETREVVLVHGERLEGQCPQCGARVEMIISPDRAACLDPQGNRDASLPAPLVAPGHRRRYIRLKALFKWFG